MYPMKKRILSFFLAFAMLIMLSASVSPAQAASVVDSGTAGSDITWRAYDDGRLVFSGSGAMDDGASYLMLDWYRCDNITDIIFEEGITYIGAYVFYDYNAYIGPAIYGSVKTITIPSTVTGIGEYAFSLPNLEAVYIRDLKAWCSIRHANFSNPLDEQADLYLNGSKVVNLVIPQNITDICDSAFKGCTSLRRVTIPSHVKCIGSMAFNTCENLEQIIFQGDPPAFGEHIFTLSTLTAYYPADNSAWNASVFNQFDSNVTWVPDKVAPFTDVASYLWYADAIKWASTQNITAGVSATAFAPNDSCTRAQVVTFLWRAAGRPEPKTQKNPFVDVKESDYFYKAVLWATENGITAGVNATHFAPHATCTRCQAVSFLYRAAGRPEPESQSVSFEDVPQDAYYRTAVLWALEKGVTSGTSAATFEPDAKCTRAQIVSFLYRYFQSR